METFEEKLARVSRDEIHLAPYDPCWPELFRQERDHLRACLPAELLGRIEHFGSTAVPGLTAKPVVDLLVEVTDLEATEARIAPILEDQGYDYFWRPTISPDDGMPWYAWFIKRDAHGARTHHIHMIEPDFPHWERLYFRDYLIAHPKVAQEYERLKTDLATTHVNDREAYTVGKTDFIARVTSDAFREAGLDPTHRRDLPNISWRP